MRKFLALFICIMLLSAIALPGYAAESDFVPSITYKGEPEVEDAEIGENDVSDCIVITSIKGAQDKTTDIDQASRDQLLDVYNKLVNDEMKLPIEGDDHVVLELVDVSLKEKDCHGEDHPYAPGFDAGKETVVALIKVDLDAGTSVSIYTYRNDAWGYVSTETVDANGYITVQIKGAGPVAFVVNKAAVDIPDTGDRVDLTPWIVLMTASMLGIVCASLIYRKKIAE